PLRDELIRSDQQTAALVPPGNELEKEMRAAALKRQVPELVDDQELWFRVKHQTVTQLSVRFAFGECRQKRRGAREKDGVAGFDNGAPERDREMRFADA